MLKDCVAVLDIGSSHVTAIVGERGVNNTFTIRGLSEIAYDGFWEGQFIDEEYSIEDAISKAVKTTSAAIHSDIISICVGIPSAFVRIENRKYKIAFNKKKKIKQEDIESLFDAGQVYTEFPGYDVICRSAMYFALEDDRRIFDPIGSASSMLGGSLTYVLGEKKFIDKISKALLSVGVEEINFVYDGLAEGQFLLDEYQRETPALLVDVGCLTTSTSILLGNGIIAKDSFDFGGGVISGNLYERFPLDSEDEIDALKKAVNLGFSRGNSNYYRIEIQGGSKDIPVNETNECVIEQLDILAGNLDSFIEENIYKTSNTLKIYVTGGGIAYIRGAKEHISSRIGLPVEILKPKILQYNKVSDSSKLSLLDYAIKHSKNPRIAFGNKSNKSFFVNKHR